jgi:hypothetical protein
MDYNRAASILMMDWQSCDKQILSSGKNFEIQRFLILEPGLIEIRIAC